MQCNAHFARVSCYFFHTPFALELFSLQTIFAFFISVHLFVSVQPLSSQTPLVHDNSVLVLLVDGLRWDYLTRYESTHFKYLQQTGGYVERVTPVFPADCMPNLFSMFTGTFPEKHGILLDTFYEPTTGKTSSIKESKSGAGYYKLLNREPLWVTAKRHGVRTFFYNFPLCDSHGNTTDHCLEFEPGRERQQLESYAKEAAHYVADGVAQLAVVYYDALHDLSHEKGPESRILDEDLLPALDNLVGDILTILCSVDHYALNDPRILHNCTQRAHLLIVSDHGMSQIAQSKMVRIGEYLPRSEIIDFKNYGSYAFVWPQNKSSYRIYKKLYGLQQSSGVVQVYRRNTIPPHWHIALHSHVPPILVVAKSGYYIVDDEEDEENRFPLTKGTKAPMTGWHGYSPEDEDMHTPLFIFGPKVLNNWSLNNSSVVDTYPLLCHLLNMTRHCHPHDGDSSLIHQLGAPPVQVAASLHVKDHESAAHILIFHQFHYSIMMLLLVHLLSLSILRILFL